MNLFCFGDEEGGIRAGMRKREYDFLALIVTVLEVSLLINVAFSIGWKLSVVAELKKRNSVKLLIFR